MRYVQFILGVLFVPALSMAAAQLAASKAITIQEAVAQLPRDVQTPHRYALVIGVGQFEDARIPKLPACGNDAKGLADVLLDGSAGLFAKEDLTLLTGEQVTKENVIDALEQLRRKVGPQDLVLVFFSGHGATDERGRSYWVMANTRVDKLRATALPETDITELLGEIKTTRLVAFIDCCYSAATANVAQAKALLDLNAIFPQFKGEGRVAITGSKGDQLSVVIKDPKHPGFGYSAFAWNLIQGLKGEADANEDGIIEVDELWAYVKDRTEQSARQQGGNQQPQLKGQIGSKFLLAVNQARLLAKARAELAASEQVRTRVEAIKKLFMEDKITAEQLKEGRRVLEGLPDQLDEQDRQRRKIYADLADGGLKAEYLQGALDKVETPAQREERLRKEKVAALLAAAKANDSKEKGKVAMEKLDELLKLEPLHAEGLKLREKIAGYYELQAFTNSVGMRLVPIKAGEYQMGGELSAAEVARRFGGEAKDFEDEHPRHRVRITKAFYLGAYEVTRGQFAAFVKDTDYRTDAEKEGFAFIWNGTGWEKSNGASWRKVGFEQTDDHPVVNVSWNDAVAFCQWLSKKEGKRYRLPTEAEWEYACRAGKRGIYPWGDDPDEGKGWCNAADQTAKQQFSNWAVFNWSDGYVYTAPTGSFKSNAWGLYDMHGNVWEWCSDWYGSYSEGEVTDPTGPEQPETGKAWRVLRGGSWGDDPSRCRVACRFRYSPVHRLYFIGFRVALDSP